MRRPAWRASLRNRAANWARRRQGTDALPVKLHRRRLYVLPSRAGAVFGALLLFMLIAGLNYANSLALFLTFLLAGFAVVVMHRSHRNLLGVVIVGAVARPAFAGEDVRIELILANDTRLARGAIEVGLPGGEPERVELAPGTRATIVLDVPTRRRGLLRVDRLQVASTFPFGLFRTWTWLHAPIDAVVYPPAHGSRPPPDSPGGRPGARAHAGTGDDEWLGLRTFRDGDSPRRIAWKAAARGGALMVKEYGAAADDLRVFDFDALHGLEVETRLEQLARWIVDAEARGDRYGLRLQATVIPCDRGPEHRHRCLTVLAMHAW